MQFFVDGQAIGPAINLTGFTGVTVTADAGDIAGNATITARYLGGRNTNPSSASLVQTVSGPEAQAPGPAAQAPGLLGAGVNTRDPRDEPSDDLRPRRRARGTRRRQRRSPS